MSGQRGLTAAAFIAAGGVGYYLYNAGGDPQAAEKAMKADAHKAAAKVKAEIPDRVGQAESKASEISNRAGSEYEKASSEAKTKLAEAQAKAQEYKEKTGKELNKAVDTFDKTVEKKAAEAKSGLSSWFGGK